MTLDAKLNILKAIVMGLMLGTLVAGCAQPAPPPEDPAGVIDIVPGQPSLIQPPSNQPVQGQTLQERPI